MITAQDEEIIRGHLKQGIQGKVLARRYEVSEMVISNIKTGKRKNHGKRGPTKLTAQSVLVIRDGLRRGIQPKVLARQHKINQATISKIKLGQRWGEVQ